MSFLLRVTKHIHITHCYLLSHTADSLNVLAQVCFVMCPERSYKGIVS
jgi:hypothetical protein